MTTTKKLAELKTLVGQAKKNIYRRIQIAVEVLADHEWIDETYNGDEGQAREELEAKYFPDLAKAYSMDQLLGIHRMFPTEKEWAKHGYHLHNMRALWFEASKTEDEEEEQPRVRWKEEAQVLEAKLDQANRRLESMSSNNQENMNMLSSLRERIKDLEDENDELKIENANLRGRIEELENMVGRSRQREALPA